MVTEIVATGRVRIVLHADLSEHISGGILHLLSGSDGYTVLPDSISMPIYMVVAYPLPLVVTIPQGDVFFQSPVTGSY